MSAMSGTLLCCQPPPPLGCTTVLEHDCQFIASEAGPESRASAVILASAGIQTQYPDISLVCDSSSSVSMIAQQDSTFLPVTNDNPWKKAWNTWRDHGLMTVLLELSGETQESKSSAPMQPASYVYYCLNKLSSFYTAAINPQSQMSVNELINTYSNLENWEQSKVRAIALHPKLPYIAVGRQDNILEIKSLNQSDHSVLLRDKKQVSLTCLQWAPHCNNLLAVGASTGVLLWNVDPATPTSRFLTAWVRAECSPGHTPVSALSWSPHGNFLVSASPADSNLIVWDIPMGVATKVRRAKGGGLSHVCWSHDGQRVFAASVGPVFRVWETQNWTCDKWTNFSGRCKAACWSPKADLLLFALEGDHSLYYLSFHGYEGTAGSSVAIKCADLAPCSLVTSNGEEIVVGGNIQSMVWDPSGERLAIIFTSDSPTRDLVAVLRTRTSHALEILQGGFIRGREGERPEIIEFHPCYADGALLATVWSSGRISFTPLCFHHSSSIGLRGIPSTFPEQLHPLGSHHHTGHTPQMSLLQDRPTVASPAVGASFVMATPLYSTRKNI